MKDKVQAFHERPTKGQWAMNGLQDALMYYGAMPIQKTDTRKKDTPPSQLSPLFVAEMMGFPPDYTILPFQNGGGKV